MFAFHFVDDSETATRVVLKTFPQLEPESDYINADHVDVCIDCLSFV
jgi:hypothetical protein